MIIDCELEEGENNMVATYLNLRRWTTMNKYDILNKVVQIHKKPLNSYVMEAHNNY